jgi:hypothetical protein
MIVLGAMLATAPASAQTYGNAAFPVCMQVFGLNPSIDCSYSSIEQCRPLAVGRAAQCIANPYYAHAPAQTVRSRHHRHAY